MKEKHRLNVQQSYYARSPLQVILASEMQLVTFVTNKLCYSVTFTADEQKKTDTQLSLEHIYHEMPKVPPWPHVQAQQPL